MTRAVASTPERSRGLRLALAAASLWLLLEALGAWLQLEGRWARNIAAVLLAGWLLLAVVAAIALRQLWRGGAMASKAAAGVGTLLLLAAFAWATLPQLGDWLGLLAGRDPAGQVVLQPQPGGRQLRLSGHLGSGDAERSAQALAAAPAIHLLQLDLAGARWHEARELAGLVRQRGLQTRIVGRCDGACTALFLAGQGRQVDAGKGLGLHRFELQAALPLAPWLARRWSAAQYRALGLRDELVFSAVGSAPAQPWLADAAELVHAGLAGIPGRPLDVALPPAAGSDVGEYLQALQGTLAWRALQARQPGLIEQAAQQMAAARAAGASDEAVQVAAQRAIEPLFEQLLQQAPYTLHEPYLALLADELAAVQPQGLAACQGVLRGDLGLRRTLPADLQLRETAWLLEAAREPAGPAKRPLNGLESEVMRRALGNGVPAMLARLRREPGNDACSRPAAVLAAIQKLPPGERKLATRLLFEKP